MFADPRPMVRESKPSMRVTPVLPRAGDRAGTLVDAAACLLALMFDDERRVTSLTKGPDDIS